MSTPQRSKLIRSVRNWKAKATARRQEIKALKKRIAELTQSRDTWRTKAETFQVSLTELQAQHTPEKKSILPAIAITFRQSKRYSP